MDQQRRYELQDKLEDILGSSNVYYEPPESLKILYPCIIYTRERVHTMNADNINYKQTIGYKITYVDRQADNDIVQKILRLQHCSYDRHYVADNLHHDVCSLYF